MPAGRSVCGTHGGARGPRRRAGLYAISGDDCGLARVVDPNLMAAEAAPNLPPITHARTSSRRHTIISPRWSSAWLSNQEGTYASLRAAHDRALAQKAFDFAVAARERLTTHDSLVTSSSRVVRLKTPSHWPRRIAFGRGCCARLRPPREFRLTPAISNRPKSSLPGACFRRIVGRACALCCNRCPNGRRARRRFVAARMDSTGRRNCAPYATSNVASSATIAALMGIAGDAPNAVVTALQRAMLQNENVANAPELFSLGARYAPLDDARRAVDALAAAVAPTRPYLFAHQLLARAHAWLRSGDRPGSIDAAGDAARAFSAMGLRRWTSEAMGLLVSQERTAERRLRGRPSGSALTEREEQVAQLIRRGARNREVAKALQISEHTVERHVSSILGRLGCARAGKSVRRGSIPNVKICESFLLKHKIALPIP